MLNRLSNSMRFAYDAITSGGRRRAPATRPKSEDLVLKDAGRRKLSATTQDVQRNFAIAAWAIRMHLNYVSAFSFQSRTGNDRIDEACENFMAAWESPYQCDVRKQHPFRRMIRLAEAKRVVDGDFAFLKLTGGASRGKLQAIESDRIATPQGGQLPDGFRAEQWTNGVRLANSGYALQYCINNRTTNGGLEFGRIVPATSMLFHGFYDRFDQVRGVSPIAAALNSLQDVYEGFDYALAKIKVSQLFGLVFYRDATDAFEGTSATLDADGDGTNDSGYEVDFGSGPQMLDLNPGDRAEFLESRSPASETTDFLKLIIHVALKSLDIPYSFFDESFTNFYGSRGGLIQYLKSCDSKRADVQQLLNDITRWRLGMAIADGELDAEFEQLKWEWVPDGVPWWDPAKEVAGHASAIAAGLDNPQRVCRQAGTDFYDNIDLISAANEYARSKGVNIVLPGVSTAQAAMQNDNPDMTGDAVDGQLPNS